MQHLDLLREPGLHVGLCRRRLRWALPVGNVFVVTKSTEPRRDLADRAVLEELMDTTLLQFFGKA